MKVSKSNTIHLSESQGDKTEDARIEVKVANKRRVLMIFTGTAQNGHD